MILSAFPSASICGWSPVAASRQSAAIFLPSFDFRHSAFSVRCSPFRRISTCRAVAQRRRICVHLPRRSPTKADLRSTAVSFSRSPRISRLNFSESEFFVFFALLAVSNSPLRRICRHFSLILSAFPSALCGFKFPLLNSQTPRFFAPKYPHFRPFFHFFSIIFRCPSNTSN